MSSTPTESVLVRYYTLLDEVAADFRIAAARTAHYDYAWGTLAGLVVVGVVVVFGLGIVYLLGYNLRDEAIADAFACIGAGGVGAVASVSWRVTVGDFFSADPGAGSLTIRRLGVLRPSIGAIFALALYFALKSGFVNVGSENRNFYFFAFLAFVAGFSERLVPELLRAAERRFAAPARDEPRHVNPGT